MSESRREFLAHATAAAAAAWALSHGPRSQTVASAEAGRAHLSNPYLDAEWEAGARGLCLLRLRAPTLPAFALMPAFALTVQGAQVDSTMLRLSEPLRAEPLTPHPEAACFAERLPGRQITATLVDPPGRYQVRWRALLREGSHYLRQEITLTAGTGEVAISRITLLNVAADGARVAGDVKGSPVTLSAPGAGGWFFAFEHPLSGSTIAAGRAVCSLTRALPLAAHHSATYSSVIGIARPGQMRRDFLRYLERERAHPYRPFLHYNSWFDLGYFTPYDQYGCLDRIRVFGDQLVRRRSVQLDSFLFDDGWDNHDNWGFNRGFPDGFTPLRQAAALIGAAPGVWLSPWGGYGPPRRERLAAGKRLGYEEDRYGLALSGPVYYKRFHQVCRDMVERYGVNQFKLDGTGSNARVVAGSDFDSDFDAAIQLIADMRALRPDLFVNLTTGTYPSPFWLRYADSTWRGGDDTSFAGEGSDRQRWITYRDGATYANVVRRGPLYPLNSLMLHGIVYAVHARGLSSDPQNEFAAGVRAYFGTGTQLQELYISHFLLTGDNWDTLAEAARWARRHAATLVDTHWVGGDPAQLEPYGHAAWSGRNAILSLRNPSSRPQSLFLDPAEAFELPYDAPNSYSLAPAWLRDQWGKPVNPEPVALEAGTVHEFRLRPFEVLTLNGY
ncbi:MAG: enterotoxin [Terriglobales bacterium]